MLSFCSLGSDHEFCELYVRILPVVSDFANHLLLLRKSMFFHNVSSDKGNVGQDEVDGVLAGTGALVVVVVVRF